MNRKEEKKEKNTDSQWAGRCFISTAAQSEVSLFFTSDPLSEQRKLNTVARLVIVPSDRFSGLLTLIRFLLCFLIIVFC